MTEGGRDVADDGGLEDDDALVDGCGTTKRNGYGYGYGGRYGCGSGLEGGVRVRVWVR